MRGFATRKASLQRLTPPPRFSITVADVAPFAGAPPHAEKVRAWALAAWHDGRAAHEYIRRWATGG